MVGWHHWLDGHEFEQVLGVGDGEGSLVCCSPWGPKVLDMTKPLNWTWCCTFCVFWQTCIPHYSIIQKTSTSKNLLPEIPSQTHPEILLPVTSYLIAPLSWNVKLSIMTIFALNIYLYFKDIKNENLDFNLLIFFLLFWMFFCSFLKNRVFLCNQICLVWRSYYSNTSFSVDLPAINSLS